jgi:hypothetical protein
METPDSNAGNEWSEMDIIDLRQSIKTGDSATETAKFLRRTIGEVREKARSLGCRSAEHEISHQRPGSETCVTLFLVCHAKPGGL